MITGYYERCQHYCDLNKAPSMVPTREGQPKVHIKVWKSVAIGVPIKSLLVLSGVT